MYVPARVNVRALNAPVPLTYPSESTFEPCSEILSVAVLLPSLSSADPSGIVSLTSPDPVFPIAVRRISKYAFLNASSFHALNFFSTGMLSVAASGEYVLLYVAVLFRLLPSSAGSGIVPFTVLPSSYAAPSFELLTFQ